MELLPELSIEGPCVQGVVCAQWGFWRVFTQSCGAGCNDFCDETILRVFTYSLYSDCLWQPKVKLDLLCALCFIILGRGIATEVLMSPTTYTPMSIPMPPTPYQWTPQSEVRIMA